jgi:high-affinity iron transporter
VGAALLITLREGLEAALIISIILAYLRHLGRTDQRPVVWWGAGLAMAASLVAGWVIFQVAGGLDEEAEEIFEGLVTLSAVGVLTWMIFWMRRQGVRIKSELQERVDVALLGGGIALASLAFVVVLREGLETALFVFAASRATAVGTGSAGAQVAGALLGLSTAVLLGYLIYRGGISLNLRAFFRVTGGLLLVVAAGLLAYSVHELQEASLLAFLDATAFDVSGLLSDESGLGAILRALIGYQDAPSVLEVVAWVAYVVVTGTLFLKPPAAVRPTAVRESLEAGS